MGFHYAHIVVDGEVCPAMQPYEVVFRRSRYNLHTISSCLSEQALSYRIMKVDLLPAGSPPSVASQGYHCAATVSKFTEQCALHETSFSTSRTDGWLVRSGVAMSNPQNLAQRLSAKSSDESMRSEQTHRKKRTISKKPPRAAPKRQQPAKASTMDQGQESRQQACTWLGSARHGIQTAIDYIDDAQTGFWRAMVGYNRAVQRQNGNEATAKWVEVHVELARMTADAEVLLKCQRLAGVASQLLELVNGPE
ncbi:hypothetical protein BAUCODRAFT_574484 [Baudoinia panamericana UAMH 10762]|uniref:Uncharacterized protein n=1 Tax=Baudoinia panamericana (strain UAMH 10762) TaxID=717646 RepID=M2N364_BAUPA|nr:uncharacterized protein BAUCODRAFT_574484 [Baudoinia panamericana UAMH 10762]EMC98398.1 hypothetical protein BAUCODRAFT_574484 [Baudoinia panamericana UAMH 10762]